MTDERERIVERGQRAMLRLQARRNLGKGNPITTEMADAIFWDEEKNKLLPLTRPNKPC